MKAKLITFVRGLKNGTPPRFQSYLKSLILLGFLTIGISQVWGGTVTYQHVFNAKPNTGNNISLSGVSWNITATNLNNYNSGNYAGVQIGASSKTGSITLTSPSSWSYTKNAVTYTKITEVRLWLNTGGSAVTPTVTIGGKEAASDGETVKKNSSAGSDWTKTSCVTFTPAANGNTGVVVVSVSTAAAGYICCLQIDCEAAAAATRTVTWKVNNDTYTAGSPTTQVNDGAAVTTLPTAPTTDCGGKTFVGWTATANYTHATAAPEDLFSTAADAPTVSGDNVTYHAVFADASAGAATPKTLSFTYNSHSDWTITTCKDNSSYYIMNTGGSIVSPTFDVSNITQITANCRTYGGASYNTINVKCEGTTLGTITAASSSLANANISFASPKPSLSGTKSLTFSPATATNANGPGVASITISYTGSSITYSNYTTSCAPPSQCQTPVISLAAGTYTEAKTATITCGTDGATIYYTTNGNTPSASSTPYTGAITVNQDMTIKAIAIKAGLENSEIATASYTINYTVTFNMMEHGSAIAALTPVKYNASINSSKPTDPSVLGYDFGGWYKENTCTNAWNWITDKVTGNITLFAKWTAKQCDLIFDKNDNEAEGSMANQSFTFNETKALTTNAFTRAHKNFTGWATSAGGSKAYNDGASYKMTTEGATLFAVWAWKQTTVTLNKDGGSGGNGSVTATYGSAMPSAGSVPIKAGYDFKGYYSGQNGTGTQYYSSTNVSVKNWDKDDATTTLYAYWTPKTITITLNANEHGEANGSFTIVYGTKAYTSFTAVTPKTGYTLRGYFAGSAGSGAVVVNPDGTLGGELYNWIDAEGNWIRSSDGTLYACYTPNKHNVSWVVSGNPWTGKGGSTKADYDSRVANVPTTVPTTSDCDFMKVFVGWTATEIVGTTNIRPSDLFTDAAGAPIIKGDATYHAVFATADESTTEYAEGTLEDLQTGKKVLLVHSGYAVSSTSSKEDYLDAVSVSVVNSKITTSNASIIWNVTKNNTQYKFDQGSNKKLNVNATGLYANTTDGSFVISTRNSAYELKDAVVDAYIDYWGSSGFSKLAISHNDNCIDFYLPATAYSEYATTCVECTNVITISKGADVAHGSYSLSKTGDVCLSNIPGGTYSVTVTATPDEHYHLATVTTTSSGTAGEVVDNTCDVSSITASTTLTAVFEEDPKVTVTWHKGTSTETTANVYVGTLYSAISEYAPTVADNAAGDCADKFMGWATASISDISGVDEEDVAWVTNDYVIDNTHKDIYAVFAKVTGEEASSIVFNKTSIGGTPASGSASRTQTSEGITFTFSEVTRCSDDGDKVRMSKSSTLTQDKALIGNITSIVFDGFAYSATSNASLTVKGCATAEGSYTTIATKDGNYTGSSIDFSSGDYKCLRLEVGSNRTVDFMSLTLNYLTTSYGNYITSCCTPLAAPTDVSAGTPGATSATITWSAVANATGYEYKLGDGDWTAAGNLSQTITGLTPCNDYSVHVRARYLGAGNYCAEGPEASVDFSTSGYTYTFIENHVSTTDEKPSTTCDGDVMLGYVAESNYTLPTTITVEGASNYDWEDGVLLIDANDVTGNVTVTITAVANSCPSYSFSYGEKGQAYTTLCFEQVGETNEWRIENFVFPDVYTNQTCYVGNQGYWYGSYLGSSGSKSADLYFADFPLALMQGVGGCPNTYKVGWSKDNSNGHNAIGALRIYTNYTDDNLYVGFIPNGYGMQYGTDGQDNWQNIAFTDQGDNAWMTDLVTLTSDMVSNGNFKYWVGLLKSGGGYTYSSSISSTNTFNAMGSYCSNWSDTHWGANLSAYHAGDKGKFRIWVNSCNGHDTKNFVCHFVPFYQATFDAAGGTCDAVLPAEPVSAEESVANRTITLPTPTKTGYDFAGWNDGVSTVEAGTQVELTSNKSYTAQWTIKTTAITLDKNNNASGNTDGSATATYGTGLSNYVAATRAETNTYKFVLTGYYTTGTGGGDIKVIDEEGNLVPNTTYTDDSGNWIGEVSELTLHARWDNYCKVTWVNNGGTVATMYIKQNETVGENMQGDLASSAACSSTYNNFVGWYTEASGTETHPAAAAPATKVTASTQVTAKTTYYAVWGNGGGVTEAINEDFSDASGGNNTSTTGSSTPWDINANFTEGSYVYQAGSAIKLGSKDYAGSITTKTITATSGSSMSISFDVKGWSSVEGKITISVTNCTTKEVEYTAKIDDNFESKSVDFTLASANPTVTIATTSKRAFIDNLVISAGTPATGYISSCCSSDVNIAITSEPASPLVLGLDGHATSTVSFAKTATHTIWMYEPTISPAGATFSDWSGEHKTANYSLTFDATAAGTYTISEEAEDKGINCSKVFNAEIVVEANPIIAAMKDDAAINALAVNGVCGGEGDANSFVIKSRYLTNAQVTVTATTSAGSGTYKVSKDGTNYSTSVNFTGGQNDLGEQTIYVRYETSSESETGTLAGNIAITSEGATTQNVTLSGTCTCSPRVTATMSNNNIVAVNGSWSAGLSEVALSAYNLTMNKDGADVTIKFESTNNNFKLKASGTQDDGKVADNLSFPVASGSDAWNQNIVVTYNPTTAGATETATITVKVIRTNGMAEYARTQFTVKGYSLPAEFVMATKVDGNWYTMTEVAAASGNTPCPGTQLVVDNTTTPTIITGVADGYLPSITVFTPATRLTPNTNAECVRFESKKKPGNFLRVPDDDTYLYFNSENSTSNSYWRMTPNPSVEGEFYIALPNNAHGRSLSAKDGSTGKTTFGHFKQTTSWRLLPLSPEVQLCTRYIAPNVQVTKLTNGSNDVTLKVSSTNGEPETLGYEYSTDHTSWTAMSGTGTSATVTLTGLTKGTDYTYYVRGIVTDETENCSGEKEVTFSPFNPIVTVTPSSLDLTCLAGETDTKTLTITPNPDAAGWTIGANPITGANASMFSFDAGTSQVTFSPAVGTADGNYTATLTIKSQAGNASANVTLTGTVVSKAAMVFGIEDLNGGMICENQITYSATGIYVYLNNGSAVYSAGDRTTKANAPAQISDAVFIRDLSTGGADVQTGFSYGVDAGVAHFIIKQANLVYGHTYRISYYNDLANNGNGLYNAEGLGFADGYVDFVYSADCEKPTAILPCITSPTTAVANWNDANCGGTMKLNVFEREETVARSCVMTNATGSEDVNAFSQRAATNWWTCGTGTNKKDGNGYKMLSTNAANRLLSPTMANWKSDITTDDVVSITLVAHSTRTDNTTYTLYLGVVENEKATNITSGGYPTTYKNVLVNGVACGNGEWAYALSVKPNGESSATFTISGLAATDRFYILGSSSSTDFYFKSLTMSTIVNNYVSGYENRTVTGTSEPITGLTAGKEYHMNVKCDANESNDVGFTMWADGAGSVKFYNNEERTSSYEITSSDNILVLGGEQTTVYLKGTKVAGCEPVVSVSAGYRIEDHSTYNPSMGALGGYVVLTLADPTQTEGTLTVTDGAGGTTVRNIISSTCPAGMNTMALPATNIEANVATAHWNNGLTFDADDKSGKLYIFRDGSVDRELIENGGFETGDLTGWNYVNAGGIYACKTYEVVNSNGHSGSYSLHVTEEGTLYAGFAFSTVIYQNPMTLYPGTYVMTSWVKMTATDCGGYSDKEAYFVQGLVGHQNQGSTNETCFAISSASTNRTRNYTYTTVTSNGTYVQLVDTFVLSKTIKALPIVGERCDAGITFRKFYLDDVTMKRISAPISDDYDKLVEIANLSTASSVAMTGLSGNTQYSYMIQDANGCSSNVITFKTLQSGEPSIEAEGIELSASQDKTATGVIVVTALDAYAPITITKCLDSNISLNTNTIPAEGGAIRVTFAPGATAAGTSGTCELSLSTTGMSNSVTVNVLWTVTAGEDVNTPKVDVTEVWTDSLTIEHNVGLDAVDSISVQFSREKKGEEIEENVGDEIFFSKYYEAYSHKKLWAIFNPRNDTISLAGMEVWRSKSDGTWNTDEVIDLSDAGFYEQGWIYPQEEIVVYTADQVGGCEQRHVDMSTWYAGAHADLALSFSGDDALLLVRNTAKESAKRHNQLRTTSAKGGDISWPDAISERGEEWHILDIIGAHDGSYNPTSEACTNWDWYNSKTKVNESGDDKGWVGYGSDMDNKRDYNDGKGHEGYLLSTNRCLLVRNKSVTSGANALANNITNMITLNTEWQGSHVPTSTPGMTQDSVSCVNFSYVGGYNYAGYYNSWTEMDDYEIAAKPNPDGSWTVVVDVPAYSCKMFHIEAVKMDTINGVVSSNVVTSTDYKVPIVVDEDNPTTADLFDFGGDTCATCDVVVRDGAKLSHETGGKSQFRELIVYPGAKFDNSSKQAFLLDRITVQSKNTEVGYAIINDNESSIRAGEVRHVKRVDDQHWYSFSLPYDCKISSIQQQNGKSMGEYAEDWVIAHYDGAKRQAEKADEHIGESSQYWIDMPSDGVLEANKAYIIGLYTTEWPGQVKNVYFPPYVATGHDAYTESGDDAKTAKIYNWTEGMDNNPARNHGWNFVGSPYISMFNETTDGQGLNNGSVIMKGKMNEAGEITEGLDNVYISVPVDPDMMTYNQVLASGQKILPFTGYFVQAKDPTSGLNETLTLVYAKDNRTLETPERRATATRQRVLVELNVIAPNGDKDNTGIWVDDRYTVDYEIGRDLMKMYGEAGRPQLYSRAADNLAMAYIALPDDQAEYVPLELYAPKAGAYILKIDENTSMTAGAQSIELLYNNEVVANLFFDAYEIAAAKAGTIRGYAVRIRRIAQVTTSNEQIGGQTVTIITNEGQMSVTNLPNDAVVSLYDVLGHRLAMRQAVDGVVNFEAPMTGVYNIVVETAAEHVTIKTVIK